MGQWNGQSSGTYVVWKKFHIAENVKINFSLGCLLWIWYANIEYDMQILNMICKPLQLVIILAEYWSKLNRPWYCAKNSMLINVGKWKIPRLRLSAPHHDINSLREHQIATCSKTWNHLQISIYLTNNCLNIQKQHTIILHISLTLLGPFSL